MNCVLISHSRHSSVLNISYFPFRTDVFVWLFQVKLHRWLTVSLKPSKRSALLQKQFLVIAVHWPVYWEVFACLLLAFRTPKAKSFSIQPKSYYDRQVKIAACHWIALKLDGCWLALLWRLVCRWLRACYHVCCYCGVIHSPDRAKS